MKPFDNDRTHAPWRKAAIIPIFSIQVFFSSINVIALGLLVGITQPGLNYITGDNDKKVHAVKPGVPTYLTLLSYIKGNC